MDFEISPRLREIAERLIDDHHPHLQDAKELIEYFIRHDGNVDWYGKCKKCTGFERFLTSKMFHIFILSDAFYNWPMEKLEALVDHELCHIQRKKDGLEQLDPETKKWSVREWAAKDEPDNWYIKEHDIEEFSDVVDRHGLWDKGIEKFAEAVRSADYQMSLADLENQKQLRVVKK